MGSVCALHLNRKATTGQHMRTSTPTAFKRLLRNLASVGSPMPLACTPQTWVAPIDGRTNLRTDFLRAKNRLINEVRFEAFVILALCTSTDLRKDIVVATPRSLALYSLWAKSILH